MITGGLVNVVPLKRPNQYTKWRHVLATPYGPVWYLVVHHATTLHWPDGQARPSQLPIPHVMLWTYVIHGRQKYIGCFDAPAFTPDEIAATATEFACTTISH